MLQRGRLEHEAESALHRPRFNGAASSTRRRARVALASTSMGRLLQRGRLEHAAEIDRAQARIDVDHASAGPPRARGGEGGSARK